MLKNADCTIFEKESFAPCVFQDVYWFDSRGMSAVKGGLQIADSILVYLYDTAYVPKAGDIIIKGRSDFVFNTESQRTISESMQVFRTAHPDFAVVRSVSDARYGGLPHIEVIAR